MIDDNELRALFQAESDEHLQSLDEGLLALEADPADAETLQRIFRDAHSLKGSARMLGIAPVEQVAHRFEDVLGAARRGEVALTAPVITKLYETLDTIRALVQEAVTGVSARVNVAEVLAGQVADIDAEVVQVDEANLPGHVDEWEWALAGINRVLDAVPTMGAVHLCFGNYGGQSIQQGSWEKLIGYLSGLHCDHVLLELAHRGNWELPKLKEIDDKIRFGLGVVDIKSNVVESGEDIARSIENAAEGLGAERIAYINPDCGFWMLKRSVADRKIRALVEGRDLFEGR